MESLYRYPRGAGAVARLLIRFSFGILLFADGFPDISTRSLTATTLIPDVVCLGLCLGLFTPITGAIAAAFSLWALFGANPNHFLVHVAMLVLSLAIAILGPGAFSIDALLFGRRRVIR